MCRIRYDNMQKSIYDFKNRKVKVEKNIGEPSYTCYVRDFDNIVQDNNNDRIIEDFANSIDWVKLTKNLDLDRIKDIVNTIGKTPGEKKAIIRAIYDAMSASNEMYLIPYSVDRLLDDLYKENDENHKSLSDAVRNSSSDTLNLDILMKQVLDKYTKKQTATNEDIDEMFDSPVVERKGINKSPNIFEGYKLPDELKNPEVEQLMQKLINAGVLTKGWQPKNLSIAERGYLVDDISSRLQIKFKWKVFGALWNENPETLRQGKNKAVGQTKTGAFIEKLKTILG